MGAKVYDNYADLITFNRNSKGTALRPIGYGDELVANGTFDTDVSGWSSSSLGVVTWSSGAMQLEVLDGDIHGGASQSITTEVGKAYIASFDIISVSSEWYITLPGIAEAESATGTQSYVFVATSTSTSFAIYARSPDLVGSDTVVVDNISVKEVLFDREDDPLTLFLHPEGVPRIEYDADRNLKGLLIEPDGENLALYSATLGQNPVLKGFRNGLAAGYAINTQYTCSLWIKRNAGSGRTIQFNDDRGFVATYDTSTIPLNTWTRISVTATSGATIVNQIDIEQFTATTPSYDSNYGTSPDGTTTSTRIYDASDEYEVWGLQFEAGPIATSYMPTTSGSFTRDKDDASMTNVSGLIGQKEGTLYFEGTMREYIPGAVNYRAPMSIEGGGNCIRILRNPLKSNEFFAEKVGGSGGLFIGFATATGTFKFALAYANNDYELYVNGVSIGSSSADVPSPFDTIGLGQDLLTSGNTRIWNDYIRAIQIIPRRLSDAQLIELTS